MSEPADKLLRKIAAIRTDATNAASILRSKEDLEKFRVEFLARKGRVGELFDDLKTVPVEEKPSLGKELNALRSEVENTFSEAQTKLEVGSIADAQQIDLSLPGRGVKIGSRHPITQTLDDLQRIFVSMGFSIADGPEIEDDYHNFAALNFPPDHPARDMQDTFFIADDVLLRTHTSPVQIRVMEKSRPPIRVVMPGRVYRNEAISARSYCLFHQIEGLYVDRNVSFSELKGTLVAFARQFYGQDIKYKFRPSFFPFTEPSLEMDITCFLCSGAGCRVCKQSGWLEILGAGMVHPNVLRNVGYDPEKYTGFAFGVGIERTTMLRLGVTDIRLLFENDMRFLKQF
ncbi:MAG TPA: phenylalanine--tRNA ligase subunit alpha [Bacteroidota bacterium]|nr:phenylalanine--tRNA ligase subunit alpha [Bacteroidota bacterium]